MVTIYVSSPYSIGDKEQNVIRSFEAGKELVGAGFGIMCPLVGHHMDKVLGLSYDKWMEIDLDWVSRCDGVVRLPGESQGADMETNRALSLGIPVFNSVDEVVAKGAEQRLVRTPMMFDDMAVSWEASFRCPSRKAYEGLMADIRGIRGVRVTDNVLRRRGKSGFEGWIEWYGADEDARVVGNCIKWIEYGKYGK